MVGGDGAVVFGREEEGQKSGSGEIEGRIRGWFGWIEIGDQTKRRIRRTNIKT